MLQPKRDGRDDSRFYFCPKCGQRWDRRIVPATLRQRRYRWLGCGLVAIALLAFTLCVLSIVGRS
jgi:hypothetical protein